MAEGSRLDLSFHQTGWIHVLFSVFSLLNYARLVGRPNGPGGESGVGPPVPMPNTAVKRSSAHDTRVIKPWENRPVPGPLGRYTSPGNSSVPHSRGLYSKAPNAGWSSGSSSGS